MKQVMILGFLGLVAIGCQKPPSSVVDSPSPAQSGLLTAHVDTLPLMQQDPAYDQLAKAYTVANIELSKRIKARIDRGEISQEQASLEFLKEQKLLNDKWMTKTNQFIEGGHSKIRTAVKAMAEEKKIDLVLIHSRVYPTVAYGSFDITQDILLKIHGNPLGGTPTPNAERTPQ